jgi:hypothetical protein
MTAAANDHADRRMAIGEAASMKAPGLLRKGGASADRQSRSRGLGGLFRIRDPRVTDQPTSLFWLGDAALARPE